MTNLDCIFKKQFVGTDKRHSHLYIHLRLFVFRFIALNLNYPAKNVPD